MNFVERQAMHLESLSDELQAMNQGSMNPEDYSTVTWVPNFKKNIPFRTCNSRAGRVHFPGSRLSVLLGLGNSDQTVVLEVFHRIFIDIHRFIT